MYLVVTALNLAPRCCIVTINKYKALYSTGLLNKRYIKKQEVEG